MVATIGGQADSVNLRARSDGKWLVVNFWATWCKPCVEEMPMLAELSRSLDDCASVELISLDVELDRLEEKVKTIGSQAGWEEFSSWWSRNDKARQSLLFLDDEVDADGDRTVADILPATVFLNPAGRVTRIIERRIAAEDVNYLREKCQAQR